MISYLKGTPVVYKDYITVIVNGVGYKVTVGAQTLQQAGIVNEIELYIYTHVKEDILDLYGFASHQQMVVFELVLSVSGVGPKTAIALTDAGTDRLIAAIQNADIQFFTSVPRVGKKMAQKIIIELTSKIGSVQELDLTPLSPKNQDLVDALTSLGFSEQDIRTVMKEVDTESLPLEEAIKESIKLLSN